MTLLSGEGLRVRYGPRAVLDGLDVAVREGEILGVLGPNGAGKTTAAGVLAGFVRPDSGRVLFRGEDVTAWPVDRRVRAGIGVLPQGPSVLGELTVEQNLALISDWVEVDVRVVLESAGLGRHAGDRARVLSGGLRRRLEVARTLASRPAVALLDEPFSAIDPIHVTAIGDLLVEARSRGAGILLTDHRVREAVAICDRLIVIDSGRVLAEGEPDYVLSHPDVRAGYLGHGFC